MSTNYYARTSATPASEEGLHIGQHAAGWEFLFRAHPERNLTTCNDWHDFLSQPDVEIVSEYGTPTSLEEFWPGATQNPAHTQPPLRRRIIGQLRPDETQDPHGHPFLNTEFH